MTDNILHFPQLGPASDFDGTKAQNARTIAWLREFCDKLEADTTGLRVALAAFIEDADGHGAVQVGGFRSDTEALRYFNAWIQQHGVAKS